MGEPRQESLQDTLRSEPISLERPRLQRPKSAVPLSRQEPAQPFERVNLGRSKPERPKSAMEGSRSQAQRLGSSQSSGALADRLKRGPGYNPFHLENRVEAKRRQAYPTLPLSIQGMGCAASHIGEGNGRVVWSEVAGFGRQGHARGSRPSSAPVTRPAGTCQ